MRCNIPSPNRALAAKLVDGDMARVMREAGTNVRDVYRAVVAKRSSDLANSAHVELNIGGEKNDRICADVIVGDHTVDYAAAHEFGIGIHAESTGKGWGRQNAADDFVKVLAIVDSMS